MRHTRLLARILLLASVAAVSACQAGVPTPAQSVDVQPFTNGAFHLELPDWDKGSDLNESELIRVQQAGRGITVSSFTGVPRLVGTNFARVLPDHGPFVDVSVERMDADNVVVEARLAADIPQRLSSTFVYCDGMTYGVSGSSPIDAWEGFEPIYQRVVGSAACESAPERAARHPGMVGMVVSPAGDDFGFEAYRQAAALTRQSGLEAAHVYLPWDRIEAEPGLYDWTLPDLLIDTLSLEGLRLSLVVEYIHTSVRGAGPPDMADVAFDDPRYIERASALAVAVANRYGDQIDYLALGNEINIYFESHPDELASYQDAFQQMRTAVAAARLDLPVGVTLAFHEAQDKGRYDLIDAFKGGDFLAYTYYPHDPGFRYDVPTDRFGSVLQSMAQASGDTPFIIVENGFSSSADLGSSEERQAEYVRRSTEVFQAQDAQIDRMVWVALHDPGGSCRQAALSFFPQDLDPATVDPAAMAAFQEYLCSLGLHRSDGTPKAAWQALLGALSSAGA